MEAQKNQQQQEKQHLNDKIEQMKLQNEQIKIERHMNQQEHRAVTPENQKPRTAFNSPQQHKEVLSLARQQQDLKWQHECQQLILKLDHQVKSSSCSDD